MNTTMKTYIFIERDYEDGIQIPIIVTAENDQEAKQKILTTYFDRYERSLYKDPKELEEARKEFMEGGLEELEEIVDNYIIFTTDMELIAYCDSYPDFRKVWEEFSNR